MRHVVFEGIDGSGKDTQIALLCRHLRRTGVTPIELHEPSYGPHGTEARLRIANGTLGDLRHQRDLFTRDRRDHVLRKIRPLRHFVDANPGFMLVQNRYYLSAPAYQADCDSLDELASMLDEQRAFAPAPDVFLVLDVPIGVALERLAKRGGSDCLESRDRLEKAKARYETLRTIDPTPQAWIDADAPEAVVAERVRRAILEGEPRWTR